RAAERFLYRALGRPATKPPPAASSEGRPLTGLVLLLQAQALEPGSLAIDNELSHQAHEGKPGTGPVHESSLFLDDSLRVDTTKGLRQCEAKVAHQNTAGQAGQRHYPEAEEQQAHQAANENAHERVAPPGRGE